MEKEEIEKFGHSALCFEFKRMNNLVIRHLHAKMAQEGYDEVTIMHSWILGFLYWNRDRDICQRDIEDNFFIAKSTVTNILKLMEKKGYVIRVADEHDARLKILRLTDVGVAMQQRTIEIIDNLHRQIEEGITDSERECFFTIINKMKDNMENSRRIDQ